MNLEFVNVYIDNMSAAAMKLALEKVARIGERDGAVTFREIGEALIEAVKEDSGA